MRAKRLIGTFVAALLVSFTDLYACEFGYLGVIGSKQSLTAVLTNPKSAVTHFVKKGDKLALEGGVSVLDVKRNEVTVSCDNQVVVVRPTGTTSSAQRETIDARYVALDSYEALKGKSEETFQLLVEEGTKLVKEGLMTAEEVNQIIADEQRGLEILEIADAAIAAKNTQ